MALISWIKHLLTIYICISVLGVWLFHKEFTLRLGLLVIVLLFLSVVFLLQIIGIVPSHKK